MVMVASYECSTRATALNPCEKPLYLTFDTGHMAVAPLVAEVLKRQNLEATFFAAKERTKTGDGSLGNCWARGGKRAGQRAMNLPRTPTTGPSRVAT